MDDRYELTIERLKETREAIRTFLESMRPEGVEPITEINGLVQWSRCGYCGATLIYTDQKYCHECRKKVWW